MAEAARLAALLDGQIARMRKARLSLSPVRMGKVVSCDGGLIEVSGLPLPIGTLCRIESDCANADGGRKGPYATSGEISADMAAEVTAEVIGFRAGHSIMMMLGDSVQLRPGAPVRSAGAPGMVAVGDAMLGRAIDASGRPIDGGPRIVCEQLWPLGGRREPALERSSVRQAFDCGIRAINALATMGVGQRLGILAGSGVGKSVLIDTIAAHAQAEIRIVALVGERAREVSDFVQRHMQGSAAARTILVAVPADHAPNLRLRGAQYACALAEYFRSQGRKVLLIVDSLTRLAHAAREIAILLGEPAAARGYPPGSLAAVTRLVERAGNSARSGGSITGIYTVLADGDDQNDPVVDTARAILDGHIVLSRELAQQGHYPAIDIPASLSRVMDGLVSEEHRQAARRFRALVSAYAANRDLVLMGAYRPGADPMLDKAMAMKPRLDAFLQQSAGEHFTLEESIGALIEAVSEHG